MAPASPYPILPPHQAAYPQPAQQAPGCGFPVLKLVALMSLATGALVHYTCGTLSDHDQPLFYRLWPTLAPGDVVLGDRIFGSFATMALLSQRGIDLVARRHAGRKERPGKCLGKGDRLVEWTATPRPPWLDPTIPLPKTLSVREVHFQVTRLGFRTKTIILATTLLDATCYPCEALAELYLQRWDMELWLRHIKTTLGMEMLRTKTPTRVAAELAMCLVGYNLIRTVMLDAAQEAQVPLPRVSFKSALVRVRLWCARLCHTTALNLCLGDYIRLLDDLARDLNPDRPGRVEPRVVKRCPKPFPWLQQPRRVLPRWGSRGGPVLPETAHRRHNTLVVAASHRRSSHPPWALCPGAHANIVLDASVVVWRVLHASSASGTPPPCRGHFSGVEAEEAGGRERASLWRTLSQGHRHVGAISCSASSPGRLPL
jgi:hypothetical protein